jgi:hypothetical protein
MKQVSKIKKEVYKPVVHTDFKFDMLRASIFVPEIQSPANLIYRKLPERWIELFDGEPTLIPVPEGAPSGIPIMQLNNKTGELQFGMSRVRIDFELRSQSTEKPIESVISFFEQVIDYLNELVNTFKLTVQRLAVNTHRFAIQENPGLYLAQHFCKEKWWVESPMNRPKQFELNAHKRFDLYGDQSLEVNSWVRNKTGISTITNESLIIVEQDINTLPEEIDVRRFSEQEILKFFLQNIKELDHILALYYPSNRRN